MRHAARILLSAAAVLLTGHAPAAAQALTPQPPAAASNTQSLRDCSSTTQSDASADGPDRTATEPAVRPDVELFATVTMKSLRFEKVGNATVTLTPQGPTSVCLVETNLPTPLEPNRTYTDVVLKLMIRTTLQELAQAAAGTRP
jgi:hypothetical protein